MSVRTKVGETPEALIQHIRERLLYDPEAYMAAKRIHHEGCPK